MDQTVNLTSSTSVVRIHPCPPGDVFLYERRFLFALCRFYCFLGEKRQSFYLITVKGNKKADLNAFRKSNGMPRLSFATPAELYDILSLTPGSVSPFGLLNDAERKVAFYIDKQLFEGNGIIGVHPNDNTATVWIKTADLVELIRSHGNACFVVDIPTVE